MVITSDNKDLTVVEIRIKFLRNLKGITQEELSKKLGVSQSLINSWENGYQNVSLRQLVKLAYFYGVPVDYIFGLITNFDKKMYKFKKDLDLKYLGKNIRIIRKIKGLTQEEFAKELHTKRSNIGYYERGKLTMSSADLKEICNDFGFSADWCLGNTDVCIRRDKKIFLDESEYKTYINI